MVETCVVLSESSPRYQDWIYVLGSNRAPVISPCVEFATFPDSPKAKPCYKLNVERLTEDQVNRLVERISQKWNVPADRVRKNISGQHGIPILAEAVTFVADLRMFF